MPLREHTQEIKYQHLGVSNPSSSALRDGPHCAAKVNFSNAVIM